MRINLIGEQTITEIGRRVMGLIREHSAAINTVFDEESGIKIAMPVEIKRDGQKNKLTIGIKFVTEKVEDQSIGWSDEQADLFATPKRACPQTKKDADEKVCESMCKHRYGDATIVNCPAWVDSDIRANLVDLMTPKAKVYELKKAANS